MPGAALACFLGLQARSDLHGRVPGAALVRLVILRARSGLREFFSDACILGRESAEPKPSPAGVLSLLAHWKSTPKQAVMCGDFRFDLEAGRSANTAAVYVDIVDENLWTELADHRVCTLDQLRALATA